jgi:hypothetical protein
MLTQRQQEIFDFIRDRQEATGNPPSMREIQSRFGFKSLNAAFSHLQALAREGMVCQDGKGSWGLPKDMISPPYDSILGLSAAEVEGLRGGDGGFFREFMKDLIQTHAYAVNVPQIEINSDSRNMRDGGCDTEVRSAATDDPEKHFDAPSCWQFKGTDAKISDARLRAEIGKPFVQKRIREGFRYVFCIAYGIPAEKVDAWESVLDAERLKINPAAPRVRVSCAAISPVLASLRVQYRLI